jgi:hypothetical protein
MGLGQIYFTCGDVKGAAYFGVQIPGDLDGQPLF